MSNVEANGIYGPVIYHDQTNIVRAKRRDDGSLWIIVHSVKDGTEFAPNAYALGENALIIR